MSADLRLQQNPERRHEAQRQPSPASANAAGDAANDCPQPQTACCRDINVNVAADGKKTACATVYASLSRGPAAERAAPLFYGCCALNAVLMRY
jgi:hypothetical protein